MRGTWLLILLCPAMLVAADAKVDFAREIRPIFQEYCFACHGPSQQMNGLRLDRRSSAFQIRGGVIIGRANAMGSQLYLRISGTTVGKQMPPTGALPAEQVHLIRDWIDQGAEWPDSLAGEKPPTAPDPKAVEIMEVLRRGDHAALDRLLRDKQAINRPGASGDTPLMYAALYGSLDSLRKLLDNGANPNLANDVGATPLMWAIEDAGKVRLLLDRGANPDAVSDDRRTALQSALARRDAKPSALLLLNHGSKLPPAAFLSRVALDETMLRALIDKGASPRALAAALPAAASDGCDACINMLTPMAEKGSVTLLGAGLSLTPARLKRLLDLGADPNVERDGTPLLLWFVTMSPPPTESVRLLMEHGAAVNVKSADGRTALDYALRQGETPVAAVLRKFGGAQGPPTSASEIKPDPAASARAAVARSIPLLQRSDVIFLRKSGCVSCHNNNLTAMTVAALRPRHAIFDPDIARSQLNAIGQYVAASRERYLQGISIAGGADTTSYILAGLAAESFPPNAATEAMARYLRGEQEADGSWRYFETRPPIESSSFATTALSLRCLQVYAPAVQREMYQQSVRRAAAWLAAARTDSTEDRVFQLLGLAWAGEKPERIRKMATALIAQQHPDGGWSQLRTLASDAYATGQALVALNRAGTLSPADPVFQRGVKFLLKTQMHDGSWYVRSRAVAVQPYFDSDFPYGADQFISAAATNWAVMALACTI